MARVDYDRQSAVYDRGRDMPPESVAAWMVAARRRAGDRSRILDLGAGTGRFSAALAETFTADVVAVEPSSGMQGKAAAKPHPRVHLVGGCGEDLPMRDRSVDLAWLSNVIHHFHDPAGAARELRRVVVQGGSVLLRGAFAGRDHDISLYRFFPASTREIDSFPSVAEVFAYFEEAGFTSFYVEAVQQMTARTYREMYDKARYRADTALEALSDEEFEQGLERLAEAARSEEQPPLDTLDLVAIS